mmetsp:Transcript_76344/g.223874  ORF Transcript_76344/g.223874 Transcript_76344/m.223874 type:complete len:334 (-) Transcript_76344:626-1627(-)
MRRHGDADGRCQRALHLEQLGRHWKDCHGWSGAGAVPGGGPGPPRGRTTRATGLPEEGAEGSSERLPEPARCNALDEGAGRGDVEGAGGEQASAAQAAQGPPQCHQGRPRGHRDGAPRHHVQHVRQLPVLRRLPGLLRGAAPAHAGHRLQAPPRRGHGPVGHARTSVPDRPGVHESGAGTPLARAAGARRRAQLRPERGARGPARAGQLWRALPGADPARGHAMPLHGRSQPSRTLRPQKVHLADQARRRPRASASGDQPPCLGPGAGALRQLCGAACTGGMGRRGVPADRRGLEGSSGAAEHPEVLLERRRALAAIGPRRGAAVDPGGARQP